MDIKEFAKLGGLARKKKYTKAQLSEMGRKGGRPKKKRLETEDPTKYDEPK